MALIYNAVTTHGVWMRNAASLNNEVSVGAMLHNKVTLTNLSFHPVLYWADPGCSCTVLSEKVGMVKPFGRASVQVDVSTEGAKIGTHEREVAIHFRAGDCYWSEHVTIRYRVQKPEAAAFRQSG